MQIFTLLMDGNVLMRKQELK